MIKVINGRPTLSYNFSQGEPLPAEKSTHRMKGKGRQHRVPTDLVVGRIRALDMPIQHCTSAKVS